MSVLKAEDITVAYGQLPVLWGVDFEVNPGEFVGIVGPNGSGKSTLLKAAVGLLPLMSGNFKYFGNSNLAQARKKIAYLPQRESIDWDFPINVLDVVLMGSYPRLGLFRRPGKKEKQEAMQALEQVGMQTFHKRQISELSGGQQQRVFFARALLQNAELYLFDEPFAAVDAKTEKTLLEIIANLKSNGKTVIVVHHDLFSVAKNTDTVILLNTRLVRYGPTQEVMKPEFLEEAYGGQLESFSRVLFEASRRPGR